MRHIDQLTVRGLDEDLAGRLHELARRKGLSLSKAALQLLRKGAGLTTDGERADVVGRSLDHLVGTWNDDQAAELQEAIEEFERLDEEM